MPMDNQAVFGGPDFDQWANREAQRGKLNTKEAFLVGRYFAPELRTLDGGTGGGRVPFALQKQGFADLHGFDFVPQSIAAARQHDTSGKIRFEVMDAAKLGYADGYFRQLIYAEHMINFLVEDALRKSALKEACRVLQTGGVAIFTTLLFETRQRSPVYWTFLRYLAIARKIRGSARPLQCQPWIKLGGRWNWAALRDAPPYTYWYRLEEFGRDLAAAGFQIEAIGTDAQLRQQQLYPNVAALAQKPLAGTLYAVCRKPGTV